MTRVGIGYDVHAFGDGRSLVLGGVPFDGERGLAGHSDADVLLHAIIDALLGAAGLGDIGTHFPPGDPQWKDVSSVAMLEEAAGMLVVRQLSVQYVDSTLIAERVLLLPAGTVRQRSLKTSSSCWRRRPARFSSARRSSVFLPG